MNLGPAEIAALVAGIGLSIKIIDKLVDAVISRSKGHNGNATDAMFNAADRLGQVAGKMDRLCDLQADTRTAIKEHTELVSRGLQALVQDHKVTHSKLDMLWKKGG